MEKSYNEYQWSIMFGDNEQIVVRKDDLKELLLDRKLVKDKISGSITDKPKEEFSAEDTAWCDVHKTKLLQATSKKTGKPYFYHRTDGKMCFGKGYQ